MERERGREIPYGKDIIGMVDVVYVGGIGGPPYL